MVFDVLHAGPGIAEVRAADKAGQLVVPSLFPFLVHQHLETAFERKPVPSVGAALPLKRGRHGGEAHFAQFVDG